MEPDPAGVMQGFSNIPLWISRIAISVTLLSLALVPSESRSQFANGADIGFLSQMEDQGYELFDRDGVRMDCLEILQGLGINSLRLRVWVNPSGGYYNKSDVAFMAHRADSMGFRVMLDFHLSDTWADPAHQTKPAAWTQHTLTQLLEDISFHVSDVLDTLRSIGVIPEWIQIGNEINDGMLWEDGRASTHMSALAAMINAGYDAAKEIDSTIQVVVHLSNGHDKALYGWMFDNLTANGARWDIIGMSVYPYWSGLPWRVEDSLSLETMQYVLARYQTKVMVCETGFLYNQPDTAKLFLSDLIQKTKSVGGLGVFYWEPEWYNIGNPDSGYQLGAWDPVTKRPTVALDAFLGSTASVQEEHNSLYYRLSAYPNPFNPSTTIEYDLPSAAHVTLHVTDLLGRITATLVDDNQNAGRHSVMFHGLNLSSGIYFYRMRAGAHSEMIKLLFLK